MSHTAYLMDQINLEEASTRRDQMQDPKRWRIYYNRRDDWPFLVAVDNGTIATQIRLQWFECETETRGDTDMGPWKPRPSAPDAVNAVFKNLREARKGKHNEPTWWIETFAIAEFKEGGVIFHEPRSC